MIQDSSFWDSYNFCILPGLRKDSMRDRIVEYLADERKNFIKDWKDNFAIQTAFLSITIRELT